ncbi:MAG: hypothetical protein C4320_02070 [Armatimonadota bacterium]
MDATTVIVGLLGVGALLTLLAPAAGLALSFVPREFVTRPWTALTYPLVISISGGLGGPIFTALLLFWTYQVGRSLEAVMTTPRFIKLWLFGTLFPALILSPVSSSLLLAGPLFPVSVLTVVWATRNANSPVLLMGFFPLAAKWIGALAALGVLATYYPAGPLIGLLALVPLGLAWAFALGRIPGLRVAVPRVAKPTKEQRRRDAEFEGEVARRRAEREEKDRLRRLLEGPAADDPTDPLR